jgi:hypothetical protein
MSRKFATHIDLLKNELRNAAVQNVATEPSSPVDGQIIFNTSESVLKIYNGTTWIAIGRLDQISAPTASLDLNSQKITNLANPTADTDAVNKNYVDSLAQGIDAKDSVRVATTTDISLTGNQIIDGVTLSDGDRVLVKDQTNQEENGIYVYNSAGAWTRALDLDEFPEAPGAFAFVEEGTTNADTGWLSSTDRGGVLDTDPITFVQFSAAGQLNGANLGTGEDVLAGKVGNELQFKSLVGDTGVVLSSDGNEITIALDASLQALSNLSSAGYLAIQSDGTVVNRVFSTGDGLTISNPDGDAGGSLIELEGNVAAVQALTGQGMAVRIDDDTWANRSITAGSGVTVTNGDGVAGDIEIAVDIATAGLVVRYTTTITPSVGVAETITHNVGNAAVLVQIYDDQGDLVEAQVQNRTANDLELLFTGNITGGSTFTVSVLG